MNEDVVPPTANDEVVETGGTALRPRPTVVDLDESRLSTSRETAVMISTNDLATEPTRDLA